MLLWKMKVRQKFLKIGQQRLERLCIPENTLFSWDFEIGQQRLERLCIMYRK